MNQFPNSLHSLFQSTIGKVDKTKSVSSNISYIKCRETRWLEWMLGPPARSTISSNAKKRSTVSSSCFFMLSILVVKNFKECVILILRIWSQISVALFLDQLKRYFLFLLLLKFFSLKRQWATAATSTLWQRSPPASTTFSRVMLPEPSLMMKSSRIFLDCLRTSSPQ